MYDIHKNMLILNHIGLTGIYPVLGCGLTGTQRYLRQMELLNGLDGTEAVLDCIRDLSEDDMVAITQDTYGPDFHGKVWVEWIDSAGDQMGRVETHAVSKKYQV